MTGRFKLIVWCLVGIIALKDLLEFLSLKMDLEGRALERQ